MCNFIKVLKEKRFDDENISYDEQNMRTRIFEPIQIKDDLWLSIQASHAHYCKPKMTLRYLDDYTHFEIGIFDKDNFLKVGEVLPNFESLSEIKRYEGRVYSNVPIDLVEELYSALIRLKNQVIAPF